MQIYFGAKWRFDIDINDCVNLGQWILNYKWDGANIVALTCVTKWSKVGEGWVEQKL
jgi:hypothetical protein